MCGDNACDATESIESCPEDCSAALYDPATCCEYSGAPTCTYQPCLDAVAQFDEFCLDNFDEFCTNCANGDFGYDNVDCGSISDACMCDAAPALGNIIEVATEAGIFTTLLTAVDAAGLTSTLADGGPFTVLAPTDDAFAALPEGTIDALLANIEALTQVLLYHVIEGTVPAEVVVTLEEAMTLAGAAVKISLTEGGVMLNDSVMVTATDVPASNGVIHIIDGVLIPPEQPVEETCGDGTCSEGEDEVSCPQDHRGRH